jgi:diguanylate cyclase (GGDEF)-like protein
METAAVYLLEGSEGVTLRAARNIEGAPIHRVTAAGGKDPVLRTALDSREPRMLTGGAQEVYPPALHPDGGSVLVVPLWNETRTLGFFLAGSPQLVTLSDETRAWLQLLATQIAAALHNAELYEKAQRESRTDSLTGLASRRHFDEAFRRELAMARRYERALSLAMIDVDQMKTINDEWGHPVGDEVLRAVGELLRDTRCGDIAARYGGDEFLLLMPDTSVEQAELAIERIRARVAEVNRKKRFPFTLRISIGVRQMGGPDVDLLAAADEAMYREKNVHRHEDIRQIRSHAEPPLDDADYGDEQDQEEEKLRRWDGR